MKYSYCLIPSIAAALAVPCSVSAVSFGQVDTFQTGTSESWHTGGGPGGAPVTFPIPASTGGPAGPGDQFLELISTGASGAGSRLSIMNTTQWAGDYIAAGITGIAMDVNNFGPSEVSLRLAFVDLTGGGAPNNIAFSTETIEIVPGSGWTHIVFPVTPADLTVALGSTAGTLQNATELRLFHNPLPAFGPDLVPAIAATLGVDNIQAVPEFGGTAGLLSTGLASLALAGRRRRCSIGLS